MQVLTQEDIDTHGSGDGKIEFLAEADSNETELATSETKIDIIQKPKLSISREILTDGIVDSIGDIIT